MTAQTFAGDKKAPMVSPLAKIERRFIDATVRFVPKWLESYHLTLMTILWSAGMIGFGWLARSNAQWLWGSSAMLFLQWLTDSYDGTVGRTRDTGLAKWGFHMDHFLDFVFMWCVVVGYVFIVHGPSVYMVMVLAFVYSCLMANSFLDFAATNEFRITHFGLGPTEVRLLFVALNTVLIFAGVQVLDTILPYALGVTVAGAAAIVYQTQRRIWAIDAQEHGGIRKAA